MYVDYSYYETVFRGTKVPLDLFDGLEGLARSYVDNQTFNRIVEVTDPIKQAVCEIMELLFEWNSNHLKSESLGDYSITYVDPTEKELFKNITAVIKRRLGTSGLLYRGVL